MKVGLVVEWLDPQRGGAETSTQQFINRLRANGVELKVCTRSLVPSESGLTVETIEPHAMSRAGRTAAFLDAAAEAMASAGCDLVHAFVPCRGADIYQPRGGTMPETIRRTLATRRSGVQRAAKRLAMRMNRRQRLMLSRERSWLSGRQPPVVIAISRYVVRQLQEHYNYPDSHIRYILNGVETVSAGADERAADRKAIRNRYGIGQHDFLLLQVCHNFRLKGVGCLLQALSCLMGPLTRTRGSVDSTPDVSVRALIVGGGRPARWRRQADRLGVADSVRFTGPSETVAAFFSAADALVHPTYYDPCSRVVLEAIAHRLPVLSTRYDGASEIIQDGISGFVLDSPDQLSELADRIRRLAQPDVRRRMSAAAGDLAERITMKRHADEVCALYSSLLR